MLVLHIYSYPDSLAAAFAWTLLSTLFLIVIVEFRRMVQHPSKFGGMSTKNRSSQKLCLKVEK